MKKQDMPACRLGDFQEERRKIVEEYARGNYIRTSADEAMDAEREKSGKKGDNDGNSGQKPLRFSGPG